MKQDVCENNKELAFLLELFVATDWGERFAELIDEHVKLPKKGKALYVASVRRTRESRFSHAPAKASTLFASMKTGESRAGAGQGEDCSKFHNRVSRGSG
jgi:hypothetical protein